MRHFKNLDTGYTWTEDEIRETYESEPILTEAYPTFDEYVEFLLDMGRQHAGGIEEIEYRYTVYICGGGDDGKEIFQTDLEIDAINYCINHDHEYPLGCTIVDEYTGEIVDNY